jgi:hypothetical protein
MTELVVGSNSAIFKPSEIVDSSETSGFWSIGKAKDSNTRFIYSKNNTLNSSFMFQHDSKLNNGVFVGLLVGWDTNDKFNTIVKGVKAGTHPTQQNAFFNWDTNDKFNTIVKGVKAGTHPTDKASSYLFRLVDLKYNKPNLDSEFRYLPTSDFTVTTELVSFTTNFDEPIDYSVIKTPLSPVDSLTSYPWDKNKVVDVYQSLNYGYGVNNFLVGGTVRTTYLIDDEAINPVDPPIITEVIRLVNIINVVKLPERTPINYTNFTLSHDLDSIAWVANFDIADLGTLGIIQPVGLTTVDLEININGELFIVFVAKTSTSLQGDRARGVQRSIKCTAYSRTKLLSYPYSPRRSHVETSSSTPAGILNGELTGTGFTGVWSSPSWTIPANIFSYFEKAPIAAISELAMAVGAVIVPTPDADELTVTPRYPVSPWNWSIATVDRTLNESEFFSRDSNWEPKQKPDSIYVYGEENGGAAVKCVVVGTAGVVTLPTIVDKYITDTIVGTERGRIEVAKQHIDELVPVTTYVDTVAGVVKPREILQINAIGGGSWRGMVSRVSLSISRNGSAVIQTLDIERYYE